jgi:hypothetical protein
LGKSAQNSGRVSCCNVGLIHRPARNLKDYFTIFLYNVPIKYFYFSVKRCRKREDPAGDRRSSVKSIMTVTR